MDAQAAKTHIEEQWPAVQVQIMEPGKMWTRDLVSNRVRLAVDENGKVTNTGNVG